jgi:hypothetical protein
MRGAHEYEDNRPNRRPQRDHVDDRRREFQQQDNRRSRDFGDRDRDVLPPRDYDDRRPRDYEPLPPRDLPPRDYDDRRPRDSRDYERDNMPPQQHHRDFDDRRLSRGGYERDNLPPKDFERRDFPDRRSSFDRPGYEQERKGYDNAPRGGGARRDDRPPSKFSREPPVPNEDDMIDRERERFGFKVDDRRPSVDLDSQPPNDSFRRGRSNSDASFRDNKRPRTEDAPQKRFSAYVACFPATFEEKDLRDFFRDCDDIESIVVNQKDRNKKYAFLNFRNERARDFALKKNGILIGGVPIVVELPDAGRRR